MSLTLSRLNSERTLCFLLKSFLFLFPWQTIWIYREVFVDGVKMEYATLGFYATEIVLWAGVIIFIIWYWRRFKSLQIKNYKLKITKDRLFVLACLSLISYLFISIYWSIDKVLALQQFLRVMEAFLLFLVLLLGPLKFGEAVKWLALGAVLPAMLGIWQFLSQSSFAFKWLGLAEHIASTPGTSVVVGDEIGRWLRAYGPFSHPNVFGGYLVLVIVLMLIRSKDQKIKRLENFLFFIFYFLFFISVFFSFSRSAWIALFLAVAGAVFLLYHAGERLRAFYLFSFSLLLFIIFISVFSFLVKERLPDNFQFNFSSSSETRSIEERQAGYYDAWQIFKSHPWLGVGAGNYTAYLQKIDPTRQPWEYQPTHNAALLFAAESGVIGIALFLSVIISFITYHISHITYQRLRVVGPRCVTCCVLRVVCYVLCVTCYATLAFFDHYLTSSYMGLILTGVFFGLVFRSEYTPKGSLLGKVVPNSSTDHSKQLNLSQDF